MNIIPPKVKSSSIKDPENNILDMPHEHQTSQGSNIQLNTYRTKMHHIRYDKWKSFS